MPTNPACPESDKTLPVQSYRNCFPGAGAPDPSWYFTHPGSVAPGDTKATANRPTGLTEGFNFGMPLLPYVLDWADHGGIMTRRKAYPTIFHAFARQQDRQFALTAIGAFVSPQDNWHPPFTVFLCGAKPFAGWRWDAHAARRWLDIAETAAAAAGAPASLDPAAALAAANAWLSGGVRAEWDRLTIERFPYDAPSVVQFWRAPSPADLSGPLPLPA